MGQKLRKRVAVLERRYTPAEPVSITVYFTRPNERTTDTNRAVTLVVHANANNRIERMPGPRFYFWKGNGPFHGKS